MKTKLLMLIFWLTCITEDISAQISFVKVFPNPYDGSTYEIFSARQTKDNGYILSAYGFTQSNADRIFRLIKSDSLGHIESDGGGIANETFGMSAIQTSDNGYLFTVNVGHNMTDYWGLIKTDSLCNEIWNKFYSNIGWMGPVSQTTDSGYIAIGISSNVLIRINSVGDIIWCKSYGGFGGFGVSSVQPTIDSGFIAIGTSNSFGAGLDDIFVVKTDASGDTLWSKTYGGPGNDIGMDIKQTPDSGYIITGSTNSFGTGTYLIKTDVNGNVSWSKTYGYGSGNTVELAANGGYNIYCGTVAIKTDANGDTLKTLASTYSFVQQTSDGGFLLNPAFTSLNKTDSNGVSCYGSATPPVIVIGNPATQTSQPSTVINTHTVTSFSALIYYLGNLGPDTTLCTTVGISPTSALPGGEGVAIAPNPFNTSTTLTIPNNLFNDNLTLSIFSMDGRILRKQNISSPQIIIERNGLAAGIYFYKISDKEVVKAVGKLVIQ